VSLEVGGDLKLRASQFNRAHAAILKKASSRLQDPIATIVLKEFQKTLLCVAAKQPAGKIEMRER